MIRTAAFVLIAWSILFSHSSHAQAPEKQSYKSFKRKSSGGNAKQLLKEADKLKFRDPAEALNRVEEALGISLVNEDEFSEAKCYVVLGEINEHIEEWKLAWDNFTKAYGKLKPGYTASEEYRRTLLGLGNSRLKLGGFEEALVYFQEALEQKLPTSEKNDLQLNISEVYYQMGKYKEALAPLEFIIHEKISSVSLTNRIQNQKAKIFAKLNEFDSSRDNFSNSVNTLNESGQKKTVDPKEEESLQNAKEEIADVLRQQKRYDDEIDLRNQSIRANTTLKNFDEVTKDKVEIGKTLEAKGETGAALREIEEAARMADTINNPKQQANAYLTLAGLYERSGQSSRAIDAYKRYSTAVGETEKLNEKQVQERTSFITKQKDIEDLAKDVSIGQREETIEQATVFRQQLIIYGLLGIIMIIGVTSFFIYKNAQESKVANQLLALKSLRSQMNPHFIFNALNSVNQFIAEQDERTANRFLSEFSQLMRLVLENSQEDFIPLVKEQEILSLYLKLEHYRFRDKFDYEIIMDESINAEMIEVPPMLIQPYIENAVWHGLRYKETMGKLTLRFLKEPSGIMVEITDDGIGRKRSAELKTENQKKHNSTGLRNIQERLAIINKVYKSTYRVSVSDRPEGGTWVRIFLPVRNQINSL